jgi:hypothetical protein
MSLLIILAIIIIAERITHYTTLELVTWILKKLWAVIEWIILFLTGMLEPKGDKS